jgi:hypothetical protein
MKSSLHSLIPFLPLFSITFDCRLSQFSAATANSRTRLNSNSSQSQSQSNFTTGGLLPISVSWRQAPWDPRSVFFQLNTCCYGHYVKSSLTGGWVCRLQLLLVIASVVILGSESLGIHDHILLSQIRYSPNLEGRVLVFIYPRNRVAQLYPRYWVPFSSPPTTRRATWDPR